jgi:hypothetical protein
MNWTDPANWTDEARSLMEWPSSVSDPTLRQGGEPVVVGTGHRPPRLGLGYDEASRTLLLEFVLPHLARLRPRLVVSGFAQGFDRALAEAAVSLGVELWAAVPFSGQESKWPPRAQSEYRQLLERCSRVFVVCPGSYHPAKFIARDHFMLEVAARAPHSVVLALYDGGQDGGTAQTVKRALDMGLSVANLFSDWCKDSREDGDAEALRGVGPP